MAFKHVVDITKVGFISLDILGLVVDIVLASKRCAVLSNSSAAVSFKIKYVCSDKLLKVYSGYRLR